MKKKYSLREAVFIVAIVNLLYFIIEYAVAMEIRSVSIFADSIDFVEDALINFLIFFSIFWPIEKKAKIGMLLSVIMIIPGLTALLAGIQQIIHQQPPNAFGISVVGLGALFVNLSCAFFLAIYKNNNCSLTKAAFLSARNDTICNIIIIITGFLTLLHHSIWYDLIVGISITLINGESALKIFKSAQKDYTKVKTEK